MIVDVGNDREIKIVGLEDEGAWSRNGKTA
jgi:hypothetical protein